MPPEPRQRDCRRARAAEGAIAGRQGQPACDTWTMASGGARAWISSRRILGTSPTPACHLPATPVSARDARVRLQSGQCIARKGRKSGRAGARGRVWHGNKNRLRPFMPDKQVSKRTARRDSKDDREYAFLGLWQAGLGRAGNAASGVCVRRALVGVSLFVIRAWCGIDDGSGAYGCARKIREHTLGGGGLPACAFPGQLAGEGGLVKKRTWSSGRGGGPMASGHRPERAARGVQPMGSSSGVWRLCVEAQERHVTRKTGCS